MVVVLHSSWADGALVAWGLPGAFACGVEKASPVFPTLEGRVKKYAATVPVCHGEMAGGGLGGGAGG
ncbi:MAG: hypothetical protein FWF96_01115, partial [Kiritimatiellaeota bacterium]|nr:hypothetical protein [Kiritimatiellota bacterium]